MAGATVIDARPKTGRDAEALAARFLEANGFTIVAKNWRRPEGELDIVAEKDRVCVFVEVRSRTGDEHGHPLEMVNPRKRARVIRAARLYLDARPTSASAFRFDVIGITFRHHAEPDLVHVPEAFEVTSSG